MIEATIGRGLNWKEKDSNKNYKGERGPGCAVNCAYCNQHFHSYTPGIGRNLFPINPGVDAGLALNSFMRVGALTLAEITTSNIILGLRSDPAYSPHQTLMFESATDPGLNWRKSIEMMNLIVEELGHEGAMLLITKLPISERNIRKLKELQGIGGHPIVMMSYGGLPEKLEPGSKSQSRITSMELLHEAGIPVIHSLRPLIEGINADDEHILSVVEQTLPNSNVIVPGGLVIDESTLPEFENRGYKLSPVYYDSNFTFADIFPNEDAVFESIRNYATSHGYEDVAIHKYVSCAVSIIMTDFYGKPTPDRIAHWAGRGNSKNNWEECAGQCPQSQIAVCKNASQIDASDAAAKAQSKLAELDGHPDNTIRPMLGHEGVLVVEDGVLNRGELYTLAAESGWYVNNLPSQGVLIERIIQVAMGKQGIELKEKDIMCVREEDSWKVHIKDISNPDDLSRWLRSSLMAHVTII